MTKFLFLLLIAASVQLTAAQSNIVPIVDMKIGGFLGGWASGRWVNAADFAPAVKKGAKYRWYRLDGTVEELVGSKSDVGEPCDDFYWLRFDGQPEDNDYNATDGVALGAAAGWNAMPRKPLAIGRSQAARLYAKSVSSALVKEGLKRPKTGNIRAWRVDLDGDGSDEVLIESWVSASKNPSPSAKVGDYSLLMIRTVSGKKVTETVIAADVTKKYVEFGAPSRFSLSAIADLNGDGSMEVVIFGAYYEGGYSAAHEFKNGKLAEIKELNAGCGV